MASANDWALLVAYGDIFLSSVIAETDAVVIAVSDFHVASEMTAGESILVISLGDFEGAVSAGEDVFLLGEGNFNVDLEAGNDIFVYAEGDVTGSYDAGRDASVITFGDFDAGLFAGRDIGGSEYGIGIPGVWAKGNITGVIDAERNIGDGSGSGLGGSNYALFENGGAYSVIFAGGTINADLYARNSDSDPIGGRIGRVGAHGNINGLFKAELLFQVFADRYERRSLLITSNLAFSDWGQIFQGERMTAALLDRLPHHCEIFEMNGESYRFRESMKQKQQPGKKT